MTDLIFDNPPPISHVEAETAFATEQPDVICRALVQIALHDPEWRWVLGICVRLADASDAGIRGTAATCIGHLARLHPEIDVDVVLPALERMLRDPMTRGRTEDALDDMGIFLSSGESRKRVARLRQRCRPSPLKNRRDKEMP